MSDMWYYEVSKEELGPVPTAEIHQLIEYGTLTPRDQVRKDGTRRWIIVAAFLDLVGPPEQATPSLEEFSDLSEISFESGASDGQPAEANAQPVQVDDDEETENEVQCYCESLGQTLGPMTIHELIRLADGGTLGETDRVRFGEHGDWVVPMEIPELAAAIFSADFGSNDDVVETANESPVEAANNTETPSGTTTTTDKPADDGAQKKKTRKSRDAKSGSAKGKAAGAKQKSGKRKKKKKSKQDALLEEIFSEVFTSDGRLKSDEERGITPKPAAASPTASSGLESATVPATPPSPGPGIPNQPISPSQPVSPGPPPRSAQAASLQAAIASASSQSPSPKRSAKSFGSDFSMPEPKTLGIAGGVLLVLLAIGGWWTGMFGGGSNVRGTPPLIKLASEYRAISSRLTPEIWADFGVETKPKVQTILDELNAIGSKTEKDDKLIKSAQTFLELLALEADDKENRETTYVNFLRNYPH